MGAQSKTQKKAHIRKRREVEKRSIFPPDTDGAENSDEDFKHKAIASEDDDSAADFAFESFKKSLTQIN
jgi:hypothetical protein